MSDVARCPECGAFWIEHRRGGGCLPSESEQRGMNFYRVLNGSHWRVKPNSPPSDPNDIVPND